MKAKIIKVEFQKEYDSKHGKLYSHKVYYDNKVAYYSSKSKEQTKFVAGKETEFTEEKRSSSKGDYFIVKPDYKKYSPYSKEVKKEQSKYSGFAMSYAKDLVCDGKIPFVNMYDEADKMFNWMVKKDKTL